MHSASQAPPIVANRLKAVLLHVPFYTIETLARLAADTGFAKSTLCRLSHQKSSPNYRTAEAIAWAISKRAGIDLSPTEIFSADGNFPTSSTCELMGCTGCLPPEAWNEETDTLRPEWRNAKPGEWSRRQADPTPPGTIHLTDNS